jgi:hypothetical protein
MRDGTQPRSQLVKKQESAQRVEGCKNGAGLFTVPKKYKKMTQKNTASRQAVAYQMPDKYKKITLKNTASRQAVAYQMPETFFPSHVSALNRPTNQGRLGETTGIGDTSISHDQSNTTKQ